MRASDRLARYGQNDAYERGWREGWAAALTQVQERGLELVLAAALHRLLRVPSLDRQLALELRHHHRLFAAVADLDYSPSVVPKLAFSRLNEAWRPAARLAQLLLRADSVRDATGSVAAISFTVDMNKLFERFVERIVDEEAGLQGWELQAQGKRRLTASVLMKPDLILRRGGVDCAVGDAKYKRLTTADWPHADLYQLLAYCVALRLSRGLLVYAEAGNPEARRSPRPASPWMSSVSTSLRPPRGSQPDPPGCRPPDPARPRTGGKRLRVA